MKKTVLTAIVTMFLGLGVWDGSYIVGTAFKGVGKQQFMNSTSQVNEETVSNLLQLVSNNVTKINMKNQIEASAMRH